MTTKNFWNNLYKSVFTSTVKENTREKMRLEKNDDSRSLTTLGACTLDYKREQNLRALTVCDLTDSDENLAP